jgi:transketolase
MKKGTCDPKDARNGPIDSSDCLAHVINPSQSRFSHQLFVPACHSMIQQQKTSVDAAFGTPEARFLAAEEQTRKTLHARFLLWLARFSSLLEDSLSKDVDTRGAATKALKALVESVLSTRSIGADLKASDFTNSHSCKTRKASSPVTAPDEGL